MLNWSYSSWNGCAGNSRSMLTASGAACAYSPIRRQAPSFFRPSLAAFLLQHPQIDIDLEEHSSRDIVRAVAGDFAEIGIVGDEVNPAKELQTFPFAEDHLVLIAPRDHAVSRQRTIAFRDTLACDHVGLPAGNALQDQMEDHAVRAGRHLKLRLRLSGFEALCQVV